MSNIKSLNDLIKFLRSNTLFIGFLALLVFLCYIKMLSAQFVSADDLAGYVNNPVIKNLGESLKSLNFYRIYYALLYQVFGINPTAIHLLSIFGHIVNTVLVLTFGTLVFGKKEAAIASVLFALHPVNSEVVSWFSGNGYLINASIVLLVLNFYALYKQINKNKYLLISLAIFSLGILIIKNSWILVTPFLITILELFVYNKKTELKNMKVPGLFFAIAAVSFLALFSQLAEQRINALENDYGLDRENATPLLNRLPYTISMFFILLVFPKDLSLFHEGEIIVPAAYAMMILFTASLPILLRLIHKKHRTETALVLLMLTSILPTMSPIQVSFFIAERYMYISTVFFSLLAALIITRLQKSSKNKHLFITLTVLICSIYFIRTFVRTGDWRNSRSLWEATSKVAINSPRVYNNLGDGYASEGDFSNSIAAFKKAVALSPTYVEATHNLANTYLQAGEYREAEIYFKKALELNPNYEGAEYAKKALEALQQKNQ